jgi:hypothetical protein
MKIPYPLLRDMIWCSFACEVLGMACYLYYGVFLEWPICQHALKLQVHKQMMIDTLLRPEPPPTFYMVQAYLQIISCPTICQFVHSTFIMVSCSDHSPFAIFFSYFGLLWKFGIRYSMLWSDGQTSPVNLRLHWSLQESFSLGLNCYKTTEGSDFNGTMSFLFWRFCS